MASSNNHESKWKVWGRTAYDKSIVISDWAAGYANAGSAKLGAERFFPKSNDFPEETAKCERILRAFTVEGVASDVKEVQVSDGKGSFIKKKRKVLRKIPPKLIKRAKGIVIYTSMRSGIAPLGGAGGVGLMLARLPDGSWSAPSSISPQNFAVGLLLGFDIFDAILLINTDAAMEKFKGHKVTLGAETAVAAGPFGAGISGEVGLDRTPVYSYVRSRGLYAGVETMAQAFLHRFDENERVYYWPGITAADIFEGKVRIPPQVEPLHRALRDAELGIAQGDSLETTVYETVKAPPNLAVKALQGDDANDILQEGERLKLPPTPQELDAMEEAGIPDEYDLELERQALQEKLEAERQEREEIRRLPPPPKHPYVQRYWANRSSAGSRRRVPPSLSRSDSSGSHDVASPSSLRNEVLSASDEDQSADGDTSTAAGTSVDAVITRKMQDSSLEEDSVAGEPIKVLAEDKLERDKDDPSIRIGSENKGGPDNIEGAMRREMEQETGDNSQSIKIELTAESANNEHGVASVLEADPVHTLPGGLGAKHVVGPIDTAKEEEAKAPQVESAIEAKIDDEVPTENTASRNASTKMGIESEAETDDFEDALTASESAPVLLETAANATSSPLHHGSATPENAKPDLSASTLSEQADISPAVLHGSTAPVITEGTQKPSRPSRPPRARPVSTLIAEPPATAPNGSGDSTIREGPSSEHIEPNTDTSANEATEAPRLMIFVDWDETITAQDTLSLIAPPAGTQEKGHDFAHYTDAYMADLSAHELAFGVRDSLEKQLAFLESIDEVEKKSVTRVEEGGLFSGVRMQDILQRAESVSFRDGWESADEWLIEKAAKGLIELDVISVGWSAAFIQQALAQRRTKSAVAVPEGVAVPRVICANEVEMKTNEDGELVGTGRLTKSKDAASVVQGGAGEASRSGIRTGFHKVEELKRLCSRFEATSPVSVYIGDSNTDLPCLLECRYGLVMGGNESLRATIERIGLQSKVIKAAEWLETARSGDEQRTLILLKDWNEALPVLERISRQA
ncbi:hypothetical protein ACQY0O_006639 [Thecaphora frezii]